MGATAGVVSPTLAGATGTIVSAALGDRVTSGIPTQAPLGGGGSSTSDLGLGNLSGS